MLSVLILTVVGLLGAAYVVLGLAYREPPAWEAMRRLVKEASAARAAHLGEPSDAR